VRDVLAARLKRRYLAFDPRTLGLYRIVFGVLLIADLLRRVPVLVPFYSNEGVLTNHYALYHPLSRHIVSLFYAFSTPGEVAFAFAVTLVIYVCFTIGAYTRLTQLASFVLLVSLHERNLLLENGGDVIMCLIMAWTLPLPLGRRFSVDAMRAPHLPDVTPVYSLAAPALLLQMVAIYLLNAIAKDGATWRDGSAVYYVLHQERLVSGVGVFLREHAPYRMLTLFTWGTLATEFAAPLLLLFCLWQRHLRWLAMLSLWGLHFGLWLTTNLSLFQLTMMSIPLLLLDAEDWARIASLLRGARQSLAEPPADGRTFWQRWRGERSSVGAGVGEAWIGFLLIACGSQLLIENPSIARHVHIRQPPFLQAVVEYGRLFQGWRMFAPDAPVDDGVLVVDALTTTGAHIDPLTGLAPRFEVAPPGGRYPMQQNWCDYTGRIRQHGYSEYRPMLRDYLLRARPDGAFIRSFDVWWVWRRTPPPGSPAATAATGRDRIFSYP
jgi:hypothetical protein